MERGTYCRPRPITCAASWHLALWRDDGGRIGRAPQSRRRGTLLLSPRHAADRRSSAVGGAATAGSVRLDAAPGRYGYGPGRSRSVSEHSIPDEILQDGSPRSVRLLLLGGRLSCANRLARCATCWRGITHLAVVLGGVRLKHDEGGSGSWMVYYCDEEKENQSN